MNYLSNLILFTSFFLTSTLLSRGQVISEDEQPEINHVLSIGVSRFIKNLFPSDNSAMVLNYHRQIDDSTYRTGANFYSNNTNKGNTETKLGLKLGYDHLIQSENRWDFYYGGDLLGFYNFYENSDRNEVEVGANPFLGIEFNISKQFTITTEPGLLATYSSVDNDDSSLTVKFNKIGFMFLNWKLSNK